MWLPTHVCTVSSTCEGLHLEERRTASLEERQEPLAPIYRPHAVKRACVLVDLTKRLSAFLKSLHLEANFKMSYKINYEEKKAGGIGGGGIKFD